MRSSNLRHRVKSTRFLKQNFALDVLICDDGLQHYQLVRDIEINVVNGEKRFETNCFSCRSIERALK